MQKKGSILFITSVPSFYKNLLFSELSAITNVKVVYSNRSPIKRDNDFFKYLDKSLILDLKAQGFLRSVFTIYKTAKKTDAVFYGGWDDIYFWLFAFLLPKKKNYVIVESSVYEYSNRKLLKKILNLFKKQFLHQNSTCIVSGHPHEMLVRKLGFKDKTIVSLSVGILDFNYPPTSKSSITSAICNFAYVGRLCKAKGIDTLIEAFSDLPHFHLHLVGTPEENFELTHVPNITWYGYKKRDELKSLLSKWDVFILPSRVEPWGLVVEEALYHGLPVLVSDKVGCNEDLVLNYDVGYIFEAGNTQSLLKAIEKISDQNNYNSLQKNISKINFKERKSHYINSFLQWSKE